jgi:hypothetical protein
VHVPEMVKPLKKIGGLMSLSLFLRNDKYEELYNLYFSAIIFVEIKIEDIKGKACSILGRDCVLKSWLENLTNFGDMV